MPNPYIGSSVRCWEQQIVSPTYAVQQPDPNPMFLEKSVYQGRCGRVYSNPFTDRVALKIVDASYRAIYLENEFIRLIRSGAGIYAGSSGYATCIALGAPSSAH